MSAVSGTIASELVVLYSRPVSNSGRPGGAKHHWGPLASAQG